MKITIDFRPRVFLDMTHYVWMREVTHTYIWLRDHPDGTASFLTLDDGAIKSVRLFKGKNTYFPRNRYWTLKPHGPYLPQRALHIFRNSTLLRSTSVDLELDELLEKLGPLPTAAPAPKPKPAAPAKPLPSPRSGGTYTLGQLCAELGKPAPDARAALRKAGIKKPGGAWVWLSREAVDAKVVKLIKALP